MRPSFLQLALAVSLSASVSAQWNPLDLLKPAKVEVAEPLPAVIPSPSSAGNGDYGNAFAAAPTPEQEAGAQPQGEAIPTQVKSTPAAPFGSFPTPVDLFNGVKPKSYEFYDGQTYTAFSERIVFRPGVFKQEGLALIALVFAWWASRSSKDANLRRALKWLNANDPVLDACFTEITAGAGSDGSKVARYVREISPTRFAAWVTGRKNLKGMEVLMDMKARTDVITAIYQFARGLADFNYKGAQDRITLDVEFASSDDACIFAICDKGNMTQIRDDNWGVRAFTTLSSSSMGLPDSLALFHETYSSAENIIKGLDAGLLEWLQGSGQGQEYFESLVLSDLAIGAEPPSEEQMVKPDALRKKRKLTLTLKLPEKSQMQKTQAPLTLLINLADAIGTGKLATSQAEQTRIKKRRQDIFSNLTRDYLKEQQEEAAEKAREIRKKEQELKYNALSPEQQRKKDEVEKRRSDRKASQKSQVQKR